MSINRPKSSQTFAKGNGLFAAYFNKPFVTGNHRHEPGWYSWREGHFATTLDCLSDLMVPIKSEYLIKAGYQVKDER